MKCTCDDTIECNNIDRIECKECPENMICMCKRKEVVEFRKKLWDKSRIIIGEER